MIEQAEILEHDADAAAQIGDRVLAELRGIPVKSVIRPRVGFSDSRMRRISVVLPAPDGPVKNWNECGSISKLMSFKISPPIP